MNILISNDDGIKARGIVELVKAMSNEGDIYVFAPDSQRSASSHALSINSNLSLREVEMEGAVKAYEVGGTPADCVKLGLFVLEQQGIKIDAVYSGINHGGNLGTDTMYSGTVSVAAEGLFSGLPAVAVSVNSHEAEHFECACDLARKVFPKVMAEKDSVGVVSINTPNLPKEQIKGVKIAGLGTVGYHEVFNVIDRETDERGEKVIYRYAAVPEILETWTDDTDAKLIREGYATISSVKFDQNDKEGNKAIAKWEVQI